MKKRVTAMLLISILLFMIIPFSSCDKEEVSVQEKISGARVSVTLSGGYVSSYSISYETLEKSTTDSIVNIGVIFKNPGDKVRVVPMAGYESFKEVDDYFASFGEVE